MPKILIIMLLAMLAYNAEAKAVTYTKEDSTKVVSLLKEGRKDNPSNLMTYYGMKFQGVPYVAHTLEVNRKEQLVVNTRQLDCSTFVETVVALSLTTMQHSVQWKDFLRNLETIRYRDGKVEGYASRNHYFLWWLERNSQKGIVYDVLAKVKPALAKQQPINLNWMTTHVSAYKMLVGDAEAIRRIGELEKASCGKKKLYIPAAKVGLPKSQLSFIHDGDILVMATKKKGLDNTHIGIAMWGKDNRLHLLNASLVHKKVILEPKTLYQYMQQNPSMIGVWVVRVK